LVERRCCGEGDMMLCVGGGHGLWCVCGGDEVMMLSVLRRSMSFCGDGGGCIESLRDKRKRIVLVCYVTCTLDYKV